MPSQYLVNPEWLVEHLLDTIQYLVPYDAASILLVDGSWVRVTHTRGYTAKVEQQLKAQSIPVGQFQHMVATGEPCMSMNTAADKGCFPDPDGLLHQYFSYLCVPIGSEDQVTGFIKLESFKPCAFTAQDADKLLSFYRQAAAKLSRAQAYDYDVALAAKLQRITQLLLINLSFTQSPAELAQHIAETVAHIFPLLEVSVFLIDTISGDAVRSGRAGVDTIPMPSSLRLDGPGLVAKALRANQLVYAPDVTCDPDYVTNRPATRSELVIPLITGLNTVGVVDLQSPEINAFSEQDIQILTAFAEHAAHVISNMQLNDALRLYVTGLEETMVERTAQLHRLNQRMSAILNSISDSIIVATENGLIKHTNPAFNREFGYQPDELFDQPLWLIADPTHHDLVEKLTQQVAVEGNMRRQNILALRKDGSVFEAEIALSQTTLNEPQIVCSLHDISHLKAVERMKDEFISTVSHELRTPISAIVLLTEALNTYYDRMTNDQIMKRLQQLRVQSNVLVEMVEAILDLSRLQRHRQKSEMVSADMSTIVAELIAELEPTAAARHQTLTFVGTEQPVILAGEPTDFARIWRNLVSNAIKYTPELGTIDVRLKYVPKNELAALAQSGLDNVAVLTTSLDLANHSYVLGQVKDNGHGIRPEDFERLFKRFERGWAKESNIPGTGLGLSLVRELLTLYGGDIHVSSRLGEGSTFTFWIPAGI